jgi:hypothetical protein
MTATGIDIDAIAVAAGKFFLVSEWAEPFDNAGPGYAKDLLVRFVRQKIPRQSRSLLRSKFFKGRLIFRVNPFSNLQTLFDVDAK